MVFRFSQFSRQINNIQDWHSPLRPLLNILDDRFPLAIITRAVADGESERDPELIDTASKFFL